MPKMIYTLFVLRSLQSSRRNRHRNKFTKYDVINANYDMFRVCLAVGKGA